MTTGGHHLLTSYQEAVQNSQEAIEGYIADYPDAGVIIPQGD